MLSEQDKEALEMLEMLIRQGTSVDGAAARLTRMIRDPELVQRVVQAREEIAARRFHLVASRSLVLDPEEDLPPWYTGPREDDIFWPSLHAQLDADPGWRKAVPSIDASSSDVVGLLADPHSPKIVTRGLVLGHVQSGKTANFTATIAKAADAGYRLFIVLSGVHNALRRQTQIRLDSQLLDLNPTKWLALTTETQDFGNPVKALPLVAGTDLRLLAVVKKNLSRLTRLRDWLLQAHEQGGLDKCPVLIIDDESDQASPNTATDPELDRTKINERIVELLLLPRVAYLGYTATPFANVLINPGDSQDIYPRDFIYPLPKPDGYFGSEELFGQRMSEEDESQETRGHDMIRYVPEEEAKTHADIAKGQLDPMVTDSMGDAIRWFVMATAARRVRSGRLKHSSMLIHTTMRVDPQNEYVPVIRQFLKALREGWNNGKVEAWRSQWENEITRERAERHGMSPVKFDEIETVVRAILQELRVVADNSRSQERLIYSDEPATVIAVGGNTLSRGLTLEGLISSYFLRSATAYDSLLQMGRWFGYRPGYEDLPRIWTTHEMATDFQFLSEVEVDLRDEIDRQSAEGATPLELPVRIQLHPRMHVTSASKMRFAVPAEASYSAQRPQTTVFDHLDSSVVEQNIRAAVEILATALREGGQREDAPSSIVLKNVPVDSVLRFVAKYSFHPDAEMNSQLLSKYIQKQNAYGALKQWNLAVITQRQPKRGVMDLGLGQPTPTLERSQLEKEHGRDPSRAVIGTLMSRPDRVIDLMSSKGIRGLDDPALQRIRNESGRGLLLLYPIDKDSAPRPNASHRIALQAVGHLIGAAFSFPAAATASEPKQYIQVDISHLDERLEVELDDGLTYIDDEGTRNEVDLDA